MRLNLPAKEIRVEQFGLQRALCAQGTSIRLVNFFFILIVQHCISIDILYMTAHAGELILLFGQD
jgi:hypothetical protein